MKNKQLYLYWLYLYILCAALGFIPAERSPLVTALLALLSVAFFIPPALLLHRSFQQGNPRHPRFIAIASGVSLALTTLLFIANTLTVLAPQDVLLGNILNALLVVLSAPMLCAPFSILGLFGWACLLVTAIRCLKKMGTHPKNAANN